MTDFSFQEAIDNLPGSIFYKNHDLIYTGCNQDFLDMLDLDVPEEVVGKSNADIEPFSQNEYTRSFEDEDRLALKGNQVIILDCHAFYKGGERFFITTKNPYYDDAGNQKGMYCLSRELLNPTACEINFFINHPRVKVSEHVLKNIERYLESNLQGVTKLTERETQCLYYISRGYTIKEIAVELGLSKKTIDSYLELVRLKLGVTERREIIRIAIESGVAMKSLEELKRGYYLD